MHETHEIEVNISKAGKITVIPDEKRAKPGDRIIWSLFCCDVMETADVTIEFEESETSPAGSKDYFFFKPSNRHWCTVTPVLGKVEVLGVVPNVNDMPALQEDKYTVRAIVKGKEFLFDPKIIKDHP